MNEVDKAIEDAARRCLYCRDIEFITIIIRSTIQWYADYIGVPQETDTGTQAKIEVQPDRQDTRGRNAQAPKVDRTAPETSTRSADE